LNVARVDRFEAKERLMTIKRLVVSGVCFVGAVFLVTGYAFTSPAAGSGSHWLSFDGPKRDVVHVTPWTPPDEQFELLTLPAEQARPPRTGHPDAGSMRPAWGMLVVLVLVFVCLWTNAEHGDVIVIYVPGVLSF
jgi:hypothetical protein